MDPGKCPSCGSPLVAGALAGQCPRCLLAGESRAQTTDDADAETQDRAASVAVLHPEHDTGRGAGTGAGTGDGPGDGTGDAPPSPDVALRRRPDPRDDDTDDDSDRAAHS